MLRTQTGSNILRNKVTVNLLNNKDKCNLMDTVKVNRLLSKDNLEVINNNNTVITNNVTK